MKVFVKLYAAFRKYHPGPNRSIPLEVHLPEGAVGADLAPALNLPAGLLRSVFINNAAATPSTVLHDGDQVGLFPPVVGGCGWTFSPTPHTPTLPHQLSARWHLPPT